MFNFTTVVFDGTSPTFISQTLRDGTPQVHSFNTKNKLNLHPPLLTLTVFQRGPYYSGIKAFINLPSYIKNLLQTKKQFKQALKEFLHFHSFYSLNEFYNYNRT